MMPTSRRFALQARLVFPIAVPPIENGVVTIEGDTIVSVGTRSSAPAPYDLGDVAILPGLVNAHTHLEFSHMRQPAGEPGVAFPDWIARIVTQQRAETLATRQDRFSAHAAAVRAGLAECLEAGVTTVGDISTVGLPGTPMSDDPVARVVFRELIGLSPGRGAELEECAIQHIRQSRRPPGAPTVGLSPHAPYTISRESVMVACRLSRAWRIPIAMHLAESLEELQLLRTGDGPLREVLEQLDAWVEEAFPGDIAPHDYLQLLTRADRSLVIHGNYLTAVDWELLARHADRISVVYCPRTHAYFQHAPYPLTEMVRAGVSLAIGTDSRASNPDLNLLRELRYVAQHYPRIEPARILQMGTLAAARALGRDARVGSLETGKRADLAIVRVDGRAAGDAHRVLFDSELPVCKTMSGGRWIDPIDSLGHARKV